MEAGPVGRGTDLKYWFYIQIFRKEFYDLTFQKHPVKCCEVKISQNDLTDTPNLNDRFIIVSLDQTLKILHCFTYDFAYCCFQVKG